MENPLYKIEMYNNLLAGLFFKEKKSTYCDSLSVVVWVASKLKPYLFTQKQFNIFKLNLVHMFLGLLRISIRHITLA